MSPAAQRFIIYTLAAVVLVGGLAVRRLALAMVFAISGCAAAMIGMRWPLTIFLLTACAGGPVEVHLDADDVPRAVESLDEAFATWGTDYVLVASKRRRGILHIELLDVVAPSAAELGDTVQMGETDLGVDHCRISIWADYDPTVVAHELGHAWGLEHADREDSWNLMSTAHIGESEDAITDAQFDDAQDAIDRFARCP